VMLVPLILIPQILFSGYSVRTVDIGPPVLFVSQIMTSFAAKRIGDASSLLFRQIDGDLIKDENYYVSYTNMNQWHRAAEGKRLGTGDSLLNPRPIFVGYFSLILWTIAGFFASYFVLARKERD
jgi:hypothetical protein